MPRYSPEQITPEQIKYGFRMHDHSRLIQNAGVKTVSAPAQPVTELDLKLLRQRYQRRLRKDDDEFDSESEDQQHSGDCPDADDVSTEDSSNTEEPTKDEPEEPQSELLPGQPRANAEEPSPVPPTPPTPSHHEPEDPQTEAFLGQRRVNPEQPSTVLPMPPTSGQPLHMWDEFMELSQQQHPTAPGPTGSNPDLLHQHVEPPHPTSNLSTDAEPDSIAKLTSLYFEQNPPRPDPLSSLPPAMSPAMLAAVPPEFHHLLQNREFASVLQIRELMQQFALMKALMIQQQHLANPIMGQQMTSIPETAHSTMRMNLNQFASAGIKQSPPQFPNAANASRGEAPSQLSVCVNKSQRQVPTIAYTTVMWRNTPGNWKVGNAQKTLDAEGFSGQYDFLYVPIDLKKSAGMGFAFVNFISHDIACRFKKKFNGYNNWAIGGVGHGCTKVSEIVWAEGQKDKKTGEIRQPLQGLDANIARWRNSNFMHEDVPDEFKPRIYKAGQRVPFPSPTKKLRPPHVRAQQNAADALNVIPPEHATAAHSEIVFQ